MNLKELLKKTLTTLKTPNNKLLALCVPIVVLYSVSLTVTDILSYNPFSFKEEIYLNDSDIIEGAEIIVDTDYNKPNFLGEVHYSEEYILENLEESRHPVYIKDGDVSVSNDVILLNEEYLLEEKTLVYGITQTTEEELVLDLNASDMNPSSAPDNLYEALNLNQYKILGFIPLPLFTVIVNCIFVITLFSIFKCYLYNFGLENIEQNTNVKVTNLPAVIGAELISSFIKIICLFLVGFSSLLTVAISPLFLPLVIVSIIIATFLAVKLSGIPYAYVTDKNLNSIDIIKKSWNLTSKNVIDILIAILVFSALILLICSPFHLFVYISSFININVYVIAVFIYYCVSGLLGLIGYTIFNIHLFKYIESEKSN